jgi:hypothetical protein
MGHEKPQIHDFHEFNSKRNEIIYLSLKNKI